MEKVKVSMREVAQMKNEFDVGMSWFVRWKRLHPEYQYNWSADKCVVTKGGEIVLIFYPRQGMVHTDYDSSILQ